MKEIVESLNGSVYSQGVKINHRAWLDMGSEEFSQTDEKLKAAAYQAAKVCGWTKQGIIAIILSEFSPRIDDFMATETLNYLEELAEKYPIEVEVINGSETPQKVIFKKGESFFKV